MAEGGKTRVIKNAPTIKADIWAHFGFYEQPDKHDLEKTRCVLIDTPEMETRVCDLDSSRT